MIFFDFLITQSPMLVVAVPLLGAFLTPLMKRLGEKIRNTFVLFILGLTGFFIIILASDVLNHGPRLYVFGATNLSLPVVRILFEVDAMSVFMATISIILAIVTVMYSWSSMKENDGLEKYYTLVLLLVASMLGMELTGDLFNFFVFLEISCISSCALIAFWVFKGEAVEAAFKYIVVSSIGALFVLFAIALLYGQYDALNIAVLAHALQYTFLDKIALVLFVVVLGMKAGLVPMHMWLPDSYGQAPTPVTIVLIGATLASLYGVIRVCFTLYGSVFSSVALAASQMVGWIVIVLAVITILVGVLMALLQTDFKRLIAYAAVAEIGYIILGVATGLIAQGTTYGVTALEGGIFHIFNDALDISLLFLVAGAVYYSTKEHSMNELGGLARNMKYTTVFFIIGFLAVAGMPPMNSFASKLLIYESTYQLNPILGIIAILGSILLLAVFVKVLYAVFLGPMLPKHMNVKEVPKSMLVAMGFIAVLIICFGLFPNLILDTLVKPAVSALTQYDVYINQVISSFSGGV